MSWENVSYVVGSKTRRAVLIRLETAKTPTILARELHTSLPNISRALRELQSKGLVECVTPNARVGKIFTLTEKGKAVLAKVRQIGSSSPQAV